MLKLENDEQLAHTRELLKEFELRYQEREQHPDPNAHIQRATLRSLRGTINQFKEQIAIYVSHREVA